MMRKLDWKALVESASTVCACTHFYSPSPIQSIPLSCLPDLGFVRSSSESLAAYIYICVCVRHSIVVDARVLAFWYIDECWMCVLCSFVPEYTMKHNDRSTRFSALLQLGKSLPDDVTNDMLEDESFLKNLHHVLLEVHVEQGALICPESGRRYAIKKGIVNMLLIEDEC